MPYPTPHYEKLVATLNSDKLPDDDRPRVAQAVEHYKQWIIELDAIMASTNEPHLVLTRMVEALNKYRFYIDIELVFNSAEDFLYRQKGQLKLDNSVIEEFLPRLLHPSLVPEIQLENLVV